LNFSSARAVVERLVIDHVGHRGDGVAVVDGQTAYVPYALAGETVEVAPVPGQPDRRRLLQVEHASPQRITPFCPHFAICGGCAIQHWDTEHYRAWKRDIVIATLAQAKIVCDVAPLIDAHGLVDRCPILDPGLSGALEAAWAIAELLISIGKPLDIQIAATDNGLDVDVRGSGPLPAKSIAMLSRVAEQHRLARVTRHGELVLMRTPPMIAIGAAQVTLPPGSFLQATAAGEEALAALVSGHCKRSKHNADLFCGVGPFALRLAATSRISAFDSDAGAVAALQKAATSTSRLKPIKAEARDLFRRPLMPQELRDYDAIVFDPPRQGAQAQVQQLAASTIPVVVAVSCNVATFARDARILVDSGYRIEGVTPVDQFRHTPHVELVARFKR
jgi:23S rRNA (uracil1939-C5)-methyltransferase